MQERHQNRNIYFKELSITSRNYFIPYIQYWHTIEAKMNVLEIGCGDGGNLLQRYYFLFRKLDVIPLELT